MVFMCELPSVLISPFSVVRGHEGLLYVISRGRIKVATENTIHWTFHCGVRSRFGSWSGQLIMKRLNYWYPR